MRSGRRVPLTLKQLKCRGDKLIAEAHQAIETGWRLAYETEKVQERLQATHGVPPARPRAVPAGGSE